MSPPPAACLAWQSIRSPFASTMLESILPTKQLTLQEVVPNVSQEALDLLTQCLDFNPDKRCSADQVRRDGGGGSEW